MQNAALPITPDEVSRASEEILASDLFAGAPLMCRLLRFLIAKATAGERRETSEYAIGIEVFERKPSQYSTAEDPSVRVQVGRLRKRLQSYYASRSRPAEIEITIPLGSYMPLIRRGALSPTPNPHHSLALHSLECLAIDEAGQAFTQGLREELVHRLFKVFGDIVVTPRFLATYPQLAASRAAPLCALQGVEHVIEGSIRLEANRIRTSIHLLDAVQCGVRWSEQFDREHCLAITLQEELASTICAAIKGYLDCHPPTDDGPNTPRVLFPE